MNLLQEPRPVHPDFDFGAEPEPFHPDPLEEAEATGYALGRAGERPLCPYRLTDPRAMRFLAGRHKGEVARRVTEARELGFAMGRETGISEPPTGFDPDEALAYRAGFAAGEAAWLDERDALAAAASAAIDRLEDAFLDPVGEEDLYPVGYYS